MKKLIIALVGLTALSLLIWFVGPLIAIASYYPLESESIRWITIGLVLALYSLQKWFKWLKAKTTNAQLFEGLLKQAPAQPEKQEPGSEEVAVLKERFEGALGQLKQMRLGHKQGAASSWLEGKRYIYELPWYMFIGAPGSGKTTALIHSGLHFPLADKFGKAAIQGIGGTRHCDWWFTDEAVLIDTAGRYTTQDSHQETDRGAWMGFLGLLKQFRPRRPLDGIILTISLSDLLQQNAQQRDIHANALRQRIQELYQQLEVQFPIYVMVTKTDLLAGFTEFFAHLGAEERLQVWGISFPFQQEAQAHSLSFLEQFNQEFLLLEQRLNEQLMARLQNERDGARRTQLYKLPQQFSSLKDVLPLFLEAVFSPSRFEVAPLVRGIYFTSGTQEGHPIDRIMGSLGRALHLEKKVLPPSASSGKSFFIHRLLKEVLFPEAGLGGKNLRWERQRQLIQWGSGIAVGLLTLSCMAAWGISYTRNKAYVETVQLRATTIAKELAEYHSADNTDILGVLPLLHSVQELAQQVDTPGRSAPLSMRFGLSQQDKLQEAVEEAYQKLLRDVFLSRLQFRVEQQLREATTPSEALYETLKAYIMFHDSEHFDSDAMKAFILYDWNAHLPHETTQEQRLALQTHLNTLFAKGAVVSPVPADTALIIRIRALLNNVPLAQRAYSRIKQLGVGAEFPEFTIAGKGGAQAGLVFARASGQPLTKGVPGLFSIKGYTSFVKIADKTAQQLAQEESWVLGLPSSSQSLQGSSAGASAKTQLMNDVRRLYLEEYRQQWENFINDIRLQAANDRQQVIQMASTLSGPVSPLTTLLKAIVTEVSLVKKADADKTALEKGQDSVQEKAAQLSALLGKDKTAVVSSPDESLEAQLVDNHFNALRALVVPPAPGQPAAIEAQMGTLKDITQMMITTDAAIKANTPPPASDVALKAKLQAGQSPEPVRGILNTLSNTASRMNTLGMKGNISNELAQLAQFCNQAIQGRYPFVKSSPRDVTQDDFAALFAPGGKLDKFVQEKLSPIVDMSKKTWTYRQVDDHKAGSSPAFIEFQRAQVIREVFFRNGSGPALKLEFKPVEMDTGLTQFVLDVDGQIVKYNHGPQIIQPVQWPGSRGSSQVRVEVTPQSGAGLGPFEGPWALFRMFDRLKVQSTAQPEKFLVTFPVGSNKALFEVTASSVQNPFRLRELEQFRCPSQL